ncbi:MAG: hypothetical protein M3Y09_12710 [Actinomycetota bacterium]|nr:hypothetical protein [Actinomycetota bacterium]
MPRGTIVADSGFRPGTNGFAFENYGNDAGAVNLTPANVDDLFGDQVCQTGGGATCVLTSSAAHWMDQINASMANGHCPGFSVSAIRFFTQNLNSRDYGAATTFGLPVQGNRKLQSLIAEDFAYQDLPAVTDHAVVGGPTAILNTLIHALRSRRENYTLAILKADGTGGHAVTPIAAEDRGNGLAAIIIYDNNFPGILRAVQVDTRRDTWRYVGGINPSDTSEIYQGDAATKSMALLPTTPGERTQPCPFCTPRGATGPGVKPTAVDRLHYIEVGITSPAAQHPHLLFTDPQGRRTGFVGGRLVNQIPGVSVVQNYSVQNWGAAPEPTYHLPLDHPNLTVTVDGSTVSRAIRTQLQVNGSGIVFYVQDIHMAPGQKDTMELPAKDLGISYATGSTFPASPLIGVQFPEVDFAASRPGKPNLRLITMATGSIGYAPDSPVTLVVNPPSGQAVVESIGARPLIKAARYVLSVDSSPITGGLRERFYRTANLPLPANTEARFQYLHPTTPQLPVAVFDSRGRSLGTVRVPPAH